VLGVIPVKDTDPSDPEVVMLGNIVKDPEAKAVDIKRAKKAAADPITDKILIFPTLRL
jgi:hypothetical protein